MLYLFVLSIIQLTRLQVPVPSCVEDGTFCDFVQAPFDSMLKPFEIIFGVFTYPIFYGIFIGIIWLKTKDIMLTGVLGVFTVGGAITGGVLTDWNDQIIQMGILLLAIAIGVVVYQLFIFRLAILNTRGNRYL